jgi:hypothetical protein
MGRIRTIKPEFPHSESMGRVSRDARLTFILLWTLSDDSGRLRGSSRMLASLLFPYDNDAKDLIDGWLSELEREGCVVRYMIDGTSYLQVCNWLNHQKIDKPSRSKIPTPEEGSRILANSRDMSSEDQGSRIKEGIKDQGSTSASATPTRSPAVLKVSRGTINPEWFLDLKLAYPNRAGDQGWRKALKAANARIVEGHMPDEFVEGARRYCAFCDATEKTGTEFVKQAATFLGPDKHFLLPWDLPATKAEVRLSKNISAAEQWLRDSDGATT